MMWTLHPASECRKGKQMNKRRTALKDCRNAFQMSFLASDDPEACHTSFEDEETDEDAEAFTAGFDEDYGGYDTEGSNTSL